MTTKELETRITNLETTLEFQQEYQTFNDFKYEFDKKSQLLLIYVLIKSELKRVKDYNFSNIVKIIKVYKKGANKIVFVVRLFGGQRQSIIIDVTNGNLETIYL